MAQPSSNRTAEESDSASAGWVSPGTRLRVLIITSEAPPVVSGISRTIALLLRGLTGDGHHVDVLSRSDYPKFIRKEIRLSAMALFWPSLRRRVANYDVVNLHGPVPTISDVLLLLIQRLHVLQRPAVVYTHHSDLAIPAMSRLCRIYNSLANRLAHNADHVVVSSIAYKLLINRFGRSPVSVIPWAVDSQQTQTPLARTHDGTLRILFVGQLRPYKGLHVLFDAIRGERNLELTVIGDGPMRLELERRIENERLINVTMMGRVADESIAKLNRLGAITCADLRSWSIIDLQRHFGKFAGALIEKFDCGAVLARYGSVGCYRDIAEVEQSGVIAVGPEGCGWGGGNRAFKKGI